METVKIIVYGTLLRGECNHFFFCNALSIRPCTISGTLYDTGFGYPAFVPSGTTSVEAEIVMIPKSDFAAVDDLEGYPQLYKRIEFAAMLSDGTMESGWIYIMNKLPDSATIIPSGSWRQR